MSLAFTDQLLYKSSVRSTIQRMHSACNENEIAAMQGRQSYIWIHVYPVNHDGHIRPNPERIDRHNYIYVL